MRDVYNDYVIPPWNERDPDAPTSRMKTTKAEGEWWKRDRERLCTIILHEFCIFFLHACLCLCLEMRPIARLQAVYIILATLQRATCAWIKGMQKQNKKQLWYIHCITIIIAHAWNATPSAASELGHHPPVSPEQPTHELLLVFSRQQTETQNRTEPELFFKHAFLCISSLSPFLSSLTGSEERRYICSVLTHVLSFPRAHGFLKSRLSRIEQIKKNLPLIKELKQKRVMRFKI